MSASDPPRALRPLRADGQPASGVGSDSAGGSLPLWLVGAHQEPQQAHTPLTGGHPFLLIHGMPTLKLFSFSNSYCGFSNLKGNTCSLLKNLVQHREYRQ